MSTIVTSNVSDGTLSIPTTFVTNGSAKAWVNFNGTGTIAARDSLNLSSLTDNGTGNYTVNFSSSFGAANYAVFKCDNERGVGEAAAGSVSASGLLVRNTTFAEADTSSVFHLSHGDLA
jgi:lipocalin